MSRVTRSSSLSPLKRTASAIAVSPAASNGVPPASRKRTKVVKAAPEPAPANVDVKAEVQESDEKAEKEGVLLHPALQFKYSDARDHLVAVDPRWAPLMDHLKCKPYEGEQTEAFNPFKSLATSIIGQQVSWLAARSITHKVVRVFYPHLPEKLAPPDKSAPSVETPFPTPAEIVNLPNQTQALRAAGLSGRKVEYIVELAERFHDGRLDAKKLWEMEDEEVQKTLIEVRGIGIWTVQMFLMFSMKRPDILAVGDLGLQKGLCKWFSHPDPTAHLLPAPKPFVAETEGRAVTPPPAPASKPEPVTPTATANKGAEAYPTPSSPSIQTLAATGMVTLPDKVAVQSPISEAVERVGQPFEFPETSNNLTSGLLRARLGKKIKGNIYLTPKEMEELTESWKPYRSIGCWYLWCVAGGAGEGA